MPKRPFPPSRHLGVGVASCSSALLFFYLLLLFAPTLSSLLPRGRERCSRLSRVCWQRDISTRCPPERRAAKKGGLFSARGAVSVSAPAVRRSGFPAAGTSQGTPASPWCVVLLCLDVCLAGKCCAENSEKKRRRPASIDILRDGDCCTDVTLVVRVSPPERSRLQTPASSCSVAQLSEFLTLYLYFSNV